MIDRHAEALLEEVPDVAREKAGLGAGPDQDVDLPRVAVDILADERPSNRGELAQDGLCGFLRVDFLHRHGRLGWFG